MPNVTCTNRVFKGFGKYVKCQNKALAVFRTAEGKRAYACKKHGGQVYLDSGRSDIHPVKHPQP